MSLAVNYCKDIVHGLSVSSKTPRNIVVHLLVMLLPWSFPKSSVFSSDTLYVLHIHIFVYIMYLCEENEFALFHIHPQTGFRFSSTIYCCLLLFRYYILSFSETNKIYISYILKKDPMTKSNYNTESFWFSSCHFSWQLPYLSP